MTGPDEVEDILDGYFPLALSIADVLRRRALPAASLRLSFAPILAVAGLPPEAPVPLNIRSGRAGMIDAADLVARRSPEGVQLSGHASWRWLDGGAVAAHLDPMIRLAEPAIVTIRPSQLPLEGGAIITSQP